MISCRRRHGGLVAMTLVECSSFVLWPRLSLRMSYVVVHRKLILQYHLHLQHPTLGIEICDRFCDVRHGCESDYEESMSDDVGCVLGYGNVVGEVNEISLSVKRKLL